MAGSAIVAAAHAVDGMLTPASRTAFTLGVDGDQVDCFLGLNPEADTCFVVRARKWGKWAQYDEDKLMLGFETAGQAARAFQLSNSDPRFLGEVDAVPMELLAEQLRTRRRQPLTRADLGAIHG